MSSPSWAKIADVLARVDFIVLAALDYRVHEGVVHRRALASDIAGLQNFQ